MNREEIVKAIVGAVLIAVAALVVGHVIEVIYAIT